MRYLFILAYFGEPRTMVLKNFVKDLLNTNNPRIAVDAQDEIRKVVDVVQRGLSTQLSILVYREGLWLREPALSVDTQPLTYFEAESHSGYQTLNAFIYHIKHYITFRAKKTMLIQDGGTLLFSKTFDI